MASKQKKAPAGRFAAAAVVVVPRTIKAGTVKFDAHGIAWQVKRLHSHPANPTWFLARVDAGQGVGRARFGNLAQIREDVAYVLEYGCLPPAGKMFA